ncbi:MAG: acetolactate synthase small subunit [Anaerolineaceae bacterium]|nr:acetolactate synthase small subunit [Anaerolineaceae bacterium]
MNQIIAALVDDKPGVLNRIASVFRRRGFNIESLTVGVTERPGISRMTIVADTDEVGAERMRLYLYKLVNVIQVENLTKVSKMCRNLAMIKVKATSEERMQIMQLAEVFRARVVDVAHESLIIEVTGDDSKIDSLVEVLMPFGILEMVRTGMVAMERGAKSMADGLEEAMLQSYLNVEEAAIA